MQIKTQPIKEAIELKNSGIAFDVYNNGAKRIGDLAVTRNGLIWSNGGTTQRSKGVTVKWDDFISWIQTKSQTRTTAPARAQIRTQAQPQTGTVAAAPARSASKSKSAAAKTGNAIEAKKPAAGKITSSAKTARKKAH